MKVAPIIISYDEEILNEQLLEITDGGITVIKGESGSGKSSFLSYLYLDFNKKPKITYLTDIYEGEKDQQIIKRKLMTYIKQSKEVVEDLTCLENIRFFAELAERKIKQSEIEIILKTVKLELSKSTYPSNLSGGEKSKLALAIALARNTPVILCDEITASLDEKNVNVIIEILKDIAYNHKKTIICTTHSKEVELIGDSVYEIKDKKLVKINSSKSELKGMSLQNKGIKNISLLDTFKVVLKRHNRNWITYLFYVIILSLSTSGLCIGLQYGNQYQNAIQLTKQYLVPNEYYLTHLNSKDYNGFLYFDRYFGIPQEQLQPIQTILSDIPSYPYYHFSIFSGSEHKDEYYCDLYMDGKLYENNDKFGQQRGKRDLNIFPFFDEQDYDRLCSELDSTKKDGLYISQDMANMLGIKDLTANYVLKMNVGVPTSSTSIVSSTNTGVSEKVNKNNLTMHEIELPIRGILDKNVTFVFGTANMYMNHTVMESIRNELTNITSILDESLPFLPSTYITFVNKNTDVISLQQQFSQIDDQLVFRSIMNTVNSISVENVQNETIIGNFVWIAMAVFGVLMFGYGFIHRRGEWPFYQHLLNFGVMKKERFKYVLSYMLLDFILMEMLSFSFIILVLEYLQKSRILLTTVNFLNILGINSLFILLGIIIINLPLIKKMLKYD